MSASARLYEAGVLECYLSDRDATKPGRLARDKPLYFLKKKDAGQLVALRDTFDEAVRSLLEVTRVGTHTLQIYESRWPVWRSELPAAGTDPYRGELRPIMWTGLGGTPIAHVDAR